MRAIWQDPDVSTDRDLESGRRRARFAWLARSSQFAAAPAGRRSRAVLWIWALWIWAASGASFRATALAWRRPRLALTAWGEALQHALGGWLQAELDFRRHWLLLAPAFALGVAWFFSAHAPGRFWPALAGAGCLALAAATRRSPGTRFLLIVLAMVYAGYAAAALRVATLETPVLRGVAHVVLTGVVVSVEQWPSGERLLAAPLEMKGRQGPHPRFVSLRLREASTLQPGDVFRARARLTAPPGAVRPGGHDFARDAWFREAGASGTMLGRPVMAPTEAAHIPLRVRLLAWVERGRAALTARIQESWGGQAGAVAAALVTGKRGQISEDTNDALRAAGLYHILSISGLHMALAAGMFFWSTRAVLALSSWCALHLPVRKMAAAVAIAGAAAYCVFSGADVATVRSLIMIAAMLGAIIVDRPALSMHNLALAALALLAWRPESLLSPGFQMSFAAVAGLVSVFGGQRRPEAGLDPRPSLLRRRLWEPLRAVALATMVCELATAPFSIWHFNAIYPLGILGNAMTLPFLSLAVMPAAVAGVTLYPLGLDWPVWRLMGLATEPVLMVSHGVAAAPEAVRLVPATGPGALICLSLALTWFVIWTTPLRWIALAPAVAGVALAHAAPPPDVSADRAGRGALVAAEPDGAGRPQLAVLGAAGDFTVRQWLRAHGDAREPDDPSLREHVRCDATGCAVRRPDGGLVIWTRSQQALGAACAIADIIVTPLAAPGACGAPAVLDAEHFALHGATSVWLVDGDVRIKTARGPGERWPWSGPSVLWPSRAPRRSMHAGQSGAGQGGRYPKGGREQRRRGPWPAHARGGGPSASGEFVQRLQHGGGVTGGLDLAPDPPDHPVRANQERAALHAHIFAAIHALFHPDAPGLEHGVVRVGGERNFEPVPGGESCVRGDAIRRNADDRGAGRLKIRQQRIKLLRFGGAAGRGIPWIKIRHDMPAAQVSELCRPAVSQGKSEFWRKIAFIQRHRLPILSHMPDWLPARSRVDLMAMAWHVANVGATVVVWPGKIGLDAPAAIFCAGPGLAPGMTDVALDEDTDVALDEDNVVNCGATALRRGRLRVFAADAGQAGRKGPVTCQG